MKNFFTSLICICILFSNCDTKIPPAANTAETKMTTPTTAPAEVATVPAVSTPTAKVATTAATATATIPTQKTPSAFAVKYVGKKGFFVNNKFIGDISTEKAPLVLADAMTAYTKQGGIVPNDLQFEIVHDPKTDEPLMGQTGALRDAVKQASMIFNKKPPVENTKATTCYLKVENEVDTTLCSFTIVGDVVTGKYNWQPWQKDGAIGNFKGKIKGNIISGIYNYTIEGSRQKDEKVFMLDNGVLKEGVGEHGDPKADGISYFTDKSKLKFIGGFKLVDCRKLEF